MCCFHVLSLPRFASSNLPYDITTPGSVPFGRTFLLVGGKTGTSVYQGTILEFEAETENWITRSEQLGTPRGFLGVTLVEESVIDCA